MAAERVILVCDDYPASSWTACGMIRKRARLERRDFWAMPTWCPECAHAPDHRFGSSGVNHLMRLKESVLHAEQVREEREESDMKKLLTG